MTEHENEGTPATGPADELGIDARRLMNAEVTLVVSGDQSVPELTLRIALFDGPTEVVPLPDRFFDGSGPTVDVGGLIEWLGVETFTPPAQVPLVHGPAPEGESSAGPTWLLVRAIGAPDPRSEDLDLGRFPGLEGNEAMMAGALEGSAPEEPPTDAVEAPVSETPPSEAEEEAWGCIGFVMAHAGIAAGIALFVTAAIVGGLLIANSGDDGGTDTSGEAGETAEEAMKRATDALFDAQTAAIEQEFTVDNPSGETTVSATGELDLGAGDAQSTIVVEGSSLSAYLSDMAYRFNGGDGWVEAEPGELAEDEEATALGLGTLGIGEPMSPLAAAYLADAAEDVVELDDGVFGAMATLPVTGAGEVFVDNWAHSTFGHPQADLEGYGVMLELRPTITDDEFIAVEITTTVVFDDVIPLLEDDPEAAQLEGITLTNRTINTEFALPVELEGRSAETVKLGEYVEQFR